MPPDAAATAPGKSRPGRAPAEFPAAPRLPAGWQALIDAMRGAVWLVDGAGLAVVAVNTAATALLGLPARRLVGRPVTEFCAAPDDLCFWDEVRGGVATGLDSETFVLRGETAVPVLRRISRLAPVAGAAPAAVADLWVVSAHDRSDEVVAHRELALAAADLRATLESTHDGLLVTDLSGRIRNFNRRFATLWELRHELLVRGDDDAVFESMRRAVADPTAYMRRLAELDDDGDAEAIDILPLRSGRAVERIVRPQLACGRPIGRVASFRDVTASIDAQRQVQALAYADALTGLPNRRLLGDRVAQSLALARRDGSGFALMAIDLDRFAAVNERLGRRVADDVLCAAAQRLAAGVRQVDTVARLGSDRFAVLAQQTDAVGAEVTAARLVEAVARPLALPDGRTAVVAASVGIVLCPGDGSDIDTLLDRAAAAVREAKAAGGAGFRFWRASAPPVGR